MKIIRKVSIAVGTLFALAVFVSLLLPSSYKVERSTIINAPAHAVFQRVNDFEQWKSWNVWDQGNVISISSNPPRGINAWHQWKNGPEGAAEATNTYEEGKSSFFYRLLFEDHGVLAMGSFKVHPEGDGTRVEWAIADKVGINPIKRWFALNYYFKAGNELEGGLANLKKLCEGETRAN